VIATKRPVFVLALALLLLTTLLSTVRPEPTLVGPFGLPSSPPSGEQTAFASFTVQFKDWLRFLVVVESIDFVDDSGTYALEEAWINEGGGGCAAFAETIEEVGTYHLAKASGYRTKDEDLRIMLRLRTTGVVSSSGQKFAGPNRAAFRLRFVGLPYVRHVQWDPNNY